VKLHVFPTLLPVYVVQQSRTLYSTAVYYRVFHHISVVISVIAFYTLPDLPLNIPVDVMTYTCLCIHSRPMSRLWTLTWSIQQWSVCF